MSAEENKEIQKAKEAAGKAAVDFVKEGMRIGLGTGSTVEYFITELGLRCRQGLRIYAVATSERSHQQGLAVGIPMLCVDDVAELDLTVDGADEVDPQMQMIKGAGGALLREKIIASMSSEMIVIIDPSKRVEQLGHASLPVEVLPFGHKAVAKELENMGYQGKWRTSGDNLYTTDSRNYIYDLRFSPAYTPREHEQRIRSIPGVIDTGFFFDLASFIIVGFADGHTEFIPGEN